MYNIIVSNKYTIKKASTELKEYINSNKNIIKIIDYKSYINEIKVMDYQSYSASNKLFIHTYLFNIFINLFIIGVASS